MKSAAIVLAGGGLIGRAHIGFLEVLIPALLRLKIEVKRIDGVSVGALNGAKLAEAATQEELLAKVKQVDLVWKLIDKNGPESIFPLSLVKIITHLTKPALLDGHTIRGLLDGSLFGTEGIDWEKVHRSPIQFGVCVQNKRRRIQEVISKNEPRFRKNPLDAVVASASLFPFFPEVIIDGTPYADGEHVNLGPAVKAGCDLIFVLLPYMRDKLDEVPADWFSRHFPILQETFVRNSAQTKKYDGIEISRVKNTACNVRALEKLHDGERSLWRNIFRRGELDARVREAGFTFKDQHESRVIDVYVEDQPSTQHPHTFEKGDTYYVKESAARTMKRVLREEDLW